MGLRNKFEKKINDQLKKAKVKFKYEFGKIPYLIAGHYVPDFVLTGSNGKIFIETKGYFRSEDKRKLRGVKSVNPSLDIRLVFYKENVSYIRWANKYGFPYAIGSVPKEWLEELK